MSDAESAARLRRVSECIRDGRPIDPIDAPPLAHGIDTYLAGTAPSLEAALGLTAPGRGQLSARRALVLRERDEALVEVHLELGGALDKGGDSEGVWVCWEALSYQSDSRGLRAHLIERIIAGSGGRVLGRRQIFNILSKEAADRPLRRQEMNSDWISEG